MRRWLVNSLLAILNSRFINKTPCQYGFIGNVDAFSLNSLRSEARQRPYLSVADLVAESDRWNSFPIPNDGLTVIEGGAAREGTSKDIEELKAALRLK